MSITFDSEKYWQWDTGRTVSTGGYGEIHISLVGASSAYVIYPSGSKADVPDELLQAFGTIICFGIEDGNAVEYAKVPVAKRAKPSDYVYTETGATEIEELADTVAELVDTLAAVSETLDGAVETLATTTETAEDAEATADVALHSSSGYCESASGYVHLGRNLATVFADEIGSDEAITWLQSRASAGDFDGLAIGDYLAVTLNDDDSTVINYQVAGFDTYYGVGDTANGHHITMVPAHVYPEYVVFNETADDNGDEEDGSPWLESYLYTWMNETFYGYLPSAWQGALKNLRVILPTRYSSSGSLTDDAGYEWADLGYVWAPSEREVWGDVRRGTFDSTIPSTDRQLPIFRQQGVVRCSSGLSRNSWWERCAASGSSASVCYVDGSGIASANTATTSYVRPLPCFHIG